MAASLATPTDNLSHHETSASGALQVPDGYIKLPHNMGIVKIAASENTQIQQETVTTAARAENEAPCTIANAQTPRKRTPVKDRTNYHKYVLVPWGETPYPEHSSPTPAACEQVFDLLKTQHVGGKLKFERPAKILPPSLEVAGCGETQFVLDALARTILSGATNMKLANKAISNIVKTYGTVTETMEVNGEETTPVSNMIDWHKVRLQGREALAEAIKGAGLQKTGSSHIMSLLEAANTCNAERAEAFRNEKLTGTAAKVPGAEVLTQGQKDMEIWMFDNNVPSLEHLRVLPVETVMNDLISFKGVGVKTAACVILFCLQEPCFAVDTHCFRLAQWLGWLPEGLREDSGRNKAFAHLDLRIPDHLKYGLHQLFIEHGQNCHRCKATTTPGSKEWDECVCPLEAFMERAKFTSGRKRKVAAADGTVADARGSSDAPLTNGAPKDAGGRDSMEAELNQELSDDERQEKETLPDLPRKRSQRAMKTDDDVAYVPGPSRRQAHKSKETGLITSPTRTSPRFRKPDSSAKDQEQ